MWLEKRSNNFYLFISKWDFSKCYQYIQKHSPWGVPQKYCYEIFPEFTGKQLCWSLFFNKVVGCRPVTLAKRDSNRGVSVQLTTISQYLFFEKSSIINVWQSSKYANVHCVKSVRIRSFSGPYSVRMRENTN